MKVTTTLNEILKYNPCNQHPNQSRNSGWNRLIDHLRHDFDRDREINLLTILDSNGVADCLWALRAAKQDVHKIAIRLAVELVKRGLPIFEKKYPNDNRPRKAFGAAEAWIKEPTEENRLKAAYAAEAAYAADVAAEAAYAAADVADVTYAVAHIAHIAHAAEAAHAAYAVAHAAHAVAHAVAHVAYVAAKAVAHVAYVAAKAVVYNDLDEREIQEIIKSELTL